MCFFLSAGNKENWGEKIEVNPNFISELKNLNGVKRCFKEAHQIRMVESSSQKEFISHTFTLYFNDPLSPINYDIIKAIHHSRSKTTKSMQYVVRLKVKVKTLGFRFQEVNVEHYHAGKIALENQLKGFYFLVISRIMSLRACASANEVQSRTMYTPHVRHMYHKVQSSFMHYGATFVRVKVCHNFKQIKFIYDTTRQSKVQAPYHLTDTSVIASLVTRYVVCHTLQSGYR